MVAKMATMIGDVTDLQGKGGLTLRVRLRVKNSKTPDHQLICLTKSSLTLFTSCPLPNGGKLSL